MFYFADHESIDERLAWSFVAERCIYLFVSTTCTAGATWIICVVVSLLNDPKTLEKNVNNKEKILNSNFYTKPPSNF